MTKPNWKNIHPHFDYHGRDWETNYQSLWEKNGFTYEQTKEWIDRGLLPTDANFCAWLRDIRNIDAETDLKSLRKDYETFLTNPTEIAEDKDQLIKDLKEQVCQLETNLEEARKEIDDLNITLLHQQKISSKKSQTKQAIREEFAESLNDLKEQNNVLVQRNNNLQSENEYLVQQINHLKNLLNQKQSSLNISEWILNHKEKLLLIGGVALVSYLILKK